MDPIVISDSDDEEISTTHHKYLEKLQCIFRNNRRKRQELPVSGPFYLDINALLLTLNDVSKELSYCDQIAIWDYVKNELWIDKNELNLKRSPSYTLIATKVMAKYIDFKSKDTSQINAVKPLLGLANLSNFIRMTISILFNNDLDLILLVLMSVDLNQPKYEVLFLLYERILGSESNSKIIKEKAGDINFYCKLQICLKCFEMITDPNDYQRVKRLGSKILPEKKPESENFSVILHQLHILQHGTLHKTINNFYEEYGKILENNSNESSWFTDLIEPNKCIWNTLNSNNSKQLSSNILQSTQNTLIGGGHNTSQSVKVSSNDAVNNPKQNNSNPQSTPVICNKILSIDSLYISTQNNTNNISEPVTWPSTNADNHSNSDATLLALFPSDKNYYRKKDDFANNLDTAITFDADSESSHSSDRGKTVQKIARRHHKLDVQHPNNGSSDSDDSGKCRETNNKSKSKDLRKKKPELVMRKKKVKKPTIDDSTVTIEKVKIINNSEVIPTPPKVTLPKEICEVSSTTNDIHMLEINEIIATKPITNESKELPIDEPIMEIDNVEPSVGSSNNTQLKVDDVTSTNIAMMDRDDGNNSSQSEQSTSVSLQNNASTFSEHSSDDLENFVLNKGKFAMEDLSSNFDEKCKGTKLQESENLVSKQLCESKLSPDSEVDKSVALIKIPKSVENQVRENAIKDRLLVQFDKETISGTQIKLDVESCRNLSERSDSDASSQFDELNSLTLQNNISSISQPPADFFDEYSILEDSFPLDHSLILNDFRSSCLSSINSNVTDVSLPQEIFDSENGEDKKRKKPMNICSTPKKIPRLEEPPIIVYNEIQSPKLTPILKTNRSPKPLGKKKSISFKLDDESESNSFKQSIAITQQRSESSRSIKISIEIQEPNQSRVPSKSPLKVVTNDNKVLQLYGLPLGKKKIPSYNDLQNTEVQSKEMPENKDGSVTSGRNWNHRESTPTLDEPSYSTEVMVTSETNDVYTSSQKIFKPICDPKEQINMIHKTQIDDNFKATYFSDWKWTSILTKLSEIELILEPVETEKTTFADILKYVPKMWSTNTRIATNKICLIMFRRVFRSIRREVLNLNCEGKDNLKKAEELLKTLKDNEIGQYRDFGNSALDNLKEFYSKCNLYSIISSSFNEFLVFWNCVKQGLANATARDDGRPLWSLEASKSIK